MPLMRCQSGGEPGWKYGPRGHCFTGARGREQAAAQGRAIQANRGKADGGRHDLGVHTIKKVDEELRVVWGEVYIPDFPDTQGEFMSAAEVRKMAHGFLAGMHNRDIDHEHDQQTDYDCVVVESFVARKGDPDFIEGAWVVGAHIPRDDLWEMVKSGEINGFSFMGVGFGSQVVIDIDIPEVVEGRTESASGHSHSYKVKLDADLTILGGSTDPGPDGHVHEIRNATLTEVAADHVHRFNLMDVIFGEPVDA